MSEARTDAELVVDLIENAERMLEDVQEAYRQLRLVDAMTSEASEQAYNRAMQLLEGYVR